MTFSNQLFTTKAYGGPVGGVNTQAAAKAADELIKECLARGSHDNMSVIIVAPGAPPSVVSSNPPSTTHSTKKQHERRPSTSLSDQLVPEIDINTFNSNSYTRFGNAEPREALNLQEDDSSDDGPLCSPRVDSGAELSEAFKAISFSDPGYSSPLNTAAGSDRVRKQLHFEDVSGKESAKQD